MSKRYEVKRFSSCYSLNWVDNKTNKELTAVEIEQTVNNQYQRIAELEEQLKDLQENGKVFSREFAIEQLEKVKKFVDRQLFITTKDCSDLDEAEAKGCNELREETIKEIDNQIKQLKELKGE